MTAPPQKRPKEGSRNVLQWAADTARIVALSTSQVLRKLDDNSISLEDTHGAVRGKPAPRRGSMPGGGVNPYESRPPPRKPERALRTAAPTAAPAGGDGTAAGGTAAGGAAKTRLPGAKRERASWWSRLFRRG